MGTELSSLVEGRGYNSPSFEGLNPARIQIKGFIKTTSMKRDKAYTQLTSKGFMGSVDLDCVTEKIS